MSTLAVDCSNYTSPLSLEQVQQWQRDGVGLVIVQAWPGRVRQQLSVCAQAGLPVDGYVFVYPGDTAALINGRLALLNDYTIRRLWLDVELSGVSQSLVAGALAVCDKYPTRLNPTGVYTGRWFWQPAVSAMANTPRFSDRPLWDSNYDNNADAAANFRPYGGWTHATIKQYLGTSTLDGVGNVDLDVLSADEVGQLTPEGPINMAISVGQGMRDAMAAVNDSPLFGHKFYNETADDGSTYSVEECYGSKGRYVSANSSGSWVNAGPL